MKLKKKDQREEGIPSTFPDRPMSLMNSAMVWLYAPNGSESIVILTQRQWRMGFGPRRRGSVILLDSGKDRWIQTEVWDGASMLNANGMSSKDAWVLKTGNP